MQVLYQFAFKHEDKLTMFYTGQGGLGRLRQYAKWHRV
jgi:hypothetical protein